VFARSDCDHRRDHWIGEGRGCEPFLSSRVAESAPYVIVRTAYFPGWRDTSFRTITYTARPFEAKTAELQLGFFRPGRPTINFFAQLKAEPKKCRGEAGYHPTMADSVPGTFRRRE
jgi:hypothetical protein